MGAVAEGPTEAEARRTSSMRHDMLEVAQAEAAVFLLDGDAVQAELAHLRPQLAREPVLGVDLGGERRDLVGGEARVVSRIASAVSPSPKSSVLSIPIL